MDSRKAALADWSVVGYQRIDLARELITFVARLLIALDVKKVDRVKDFLMLHDVF